LKLHEGQGLAGIVGDPEADAPATGKGDVPNVVEI
jgi:hypothetical protein